MAVIETQSHIKAPGRNDVIICICRGKNEKDVMRSIGNGASTVRDLQRCGIGDQCGSCINSLRDMLAKSAAAAAAAAPVPCPACSQPQPAFA